MKIAKLLNITILALLGLTLPMTGKSQVYTISFDTGTASDWKVTAGGISGATPYICNFAIDNNPANGFLNCLCVTSTGDANGSFLPGGNVANFDGFWVADFTFFLPANATSISLNYGNFYVDDRAVLTLNGNIFDATGLLVDWVQNGTPSMVLTDGGPLVPYSSFSSSLDGFVSGNVTSGFNMGGLNTIEAIINNTGNGVYGPNQDINPNDGTDFALTGTVSYSVVPEPSSLAIIGLGLVSVTFLRRRQC
ncbi:MAG TPA: PEP-CTERM sorting domain-containing protein [Verrucomicrobiae bacterium]|nr:PEP-CTERM sorting domain-containing protein [Verrucomicrobiae bacterium]